MPDTATPPEPRLYPYVRVTGSPRERGHQHGVQAHGRIARNVEHYRGVFSQKYAMSWDNVMRQAGALLPQIHEYDSDATAELEGIAAGSGQSVEAIVVLNSRTEIVHAGYVAQCTTAAVLPHRSTTGHTLLVQNWDWMLGAIDTSVLLHAVTDDGVEYVSLHEAGQLVRGGFNSHGFGCVGNFVASETPDDKVGIPLPVIGRRIMLAESLEEAAEYAKAGPRSISINYLMASSAGRALDIETTSEEAFPIEPADGLLLHTNHFLTSGIPDLGLPRMPDSALRLDRGHALLSPHTTIGVESLFGILADHENHPRSICKHPSKPGPFADVTLASIVMDLDAGVMWMTQGNPCENPYEKWDLFGKETREPSMEGTADAAAG